VSLLFWKSAAALMLVVGSLNRSLHASRRYIYVLHTRYLWLESSRSYPLSPPPRQRKPREMTRKEFFGYTGLLSTVPGEDDLPLVITAEKYGAGLKPAGHGTGQHCFCRKPVLSFLQQTSGKFAFASWSISIDPLRMRLSVEKRTQVRSWTMRRNRHS
jgi:hypothetical protein